MTEQTVPVPPTDSPEEEKKSHRFFNPRVIAGVVTAAVAATAAVVFHKLKSGDDSTSQDSGLTTELFNVND